MKSLILFILLLPFTSFAQLKIEGQVIDAATGKPIPNASVFFANETLGAKAADDGSFVLSNFREGQHQLVVTVVGYEMYAKTLLIRSSLKLAPIQMAAKTMALNTVKIQGYDPGWEQKLAMFKKHFLGLSYFSAQCEILNPKTLNLRFSNNGNVLTGDSDDFLEIVNKALGYKLKYLVTSFKADEETKEVAYGGSVLFEEMIGTPQQQAHWKRNREDAYYGSPTDFLRQVAANSVNKDYLVQAQCITRLDTSKYYLSVKMIFDPLETANYIYPTQERGIFAMKYESDLQITHFVKKKKKRIPTVVGMVKFIEPYLYFDGNGTILNPLGSMFRMQWSESRVAELLPSDYWPTEG